MKKYKLRGKLKRIIKISSLTLGILIFLYILLSFLINIGELSERLLSLGIGIALLFAGIFYDRIQDKTGAKTKIVLRILNVLIYIFVTFFIVVCSVILISAKTQLPPSDEPAVLIVLGAKIDGDYPSQTLKMRLDAAADYMNAHTNADIKCVVSGGQGPNEIMPEADAMYNYLVKKGIDPKKILIEDKSSNTKENFILSKTLLNADYDGKIPKNIIIVTNDFHVLRSKLLASYLGFGDCNIYSIASPTPPMFFPVLTAREFMAVFKSLIFDIGIGNL